MRFAALMGSVVLALAPVASFAAEEMSYSNVELKYLSLSLNDSTFNVNGDGFAVSGSYEVGSKVFLLGEWQDQSYDFGVDGISSTVDFVGTLSYIDSKASAGNVSASDNGFGLGGGIRARLSKEFEIDAGLKYVDFDNSGSDTGLAVNGRWYFKKNMALGFGIDSTDNVDVWHVGFRAEF